MRRPRRWIGALGISALVLAGGVALVTTSGTTSPASASGNARAAIGPAAPARVAPTASRSPLGSGATVRTATATVAGVAETILVNRGGLPLYTYAPDTATVSKVSGELAALWPPLTASTQVNQSTVGTVAIVPTSNGRQVTYNGHFLYTFVEDSPGLVTGQGVQNFMVATPTITNIGPSSTPGGSAPGAASTGSVPGY
jgi:predicted lipoprotein with Yx(FWY)xxD motif